MCHVQSRDVAIRHVTAVHVMPGEAGAPHAQVTPLRATDAETSLNQTSAQQTAQQNCVFHAKQNLYATCSEQNVRTYLSSPLDTREFTHYDEACVSRCAECCGRHAPRRAHRDAGPPCSPRDASAVHRVLGY